MKNGSIGAIFGGFITYFMVSCTTITPEPTPQVPLPETVTECKLGAWCEAYTTILEQKYREHEDVLSKADYSGLCKSKTISKKDIFIAISRSVAWAESSWKANETYDEKFKDDTTGKTAVSVGLFQLSVSDGIYYKQYSSCKEINETTLFYPTINAGCWADIITHLLKKYNGDFLVAGGKYWSVLRPSNNRHKVVKQKLFEIIPECE